MGVSPRNAVANRMSRESGGSDAVAHGLPPLSRLENSLTTTPWADAHGYMLTPHSRLMYRPIHLATSIVNQNLPQSFIPRPPRDDALAEPTPFPVFVANTVALVTRRG